MALPRPEFGLLVSATTAPMTASGTESLSPTKICGRAHGTRTLRYVCQREADNRSEEHTSELQSQSNLVCRLLLEKKKHRTLNAVVLLARFVSGVPPAPPVLAEVGPRVATLAHDIPRAGVDAGARGRGLARRGSAP